MQALWSKTFAHEDLPKLATEVVTALAGSEPFCLWLQGPLGAGKTTVFNLLTKVLKPSGGQILYKGRDVTRERSAAIARQGMVRSFQISAVFAHMSVAGRLRCAWVASTPA